MTEFEKLHQEKVLRISEQLKQFYKQKRQVRIYHGSTNSTRKQNFSKNAIIETTDLNNVVEINIQKRYALAEPNVSMDQLVNGTLRYGLIPSVIMEFPGITAGGGINGAALESSSFKYGQFSDICEEYEIILANGKLIKASAKQNEDIFYGLSGSYGSLGIISLIKLRLIPSAKYVSAVFYPVQSYKECTGLMQEQISRKKADYLEGIIFSPHSGVVITGTFTDTESSPVKTYTNAKDPWFYERAEKAAKENKIHRELIPLKDYIFRYNRGAFWMGEYFFKLFHLPSTRVTKVLLNPLMNTRKLYDGLHALNISQKYFIQDFYLPINKTVSFLKYSESQLGIFPLWLCPVKPSKSPQKLSPHYIRSPMLMDVGIWGQTDAYLKDPIRMNKKLENYTKEINGRKMFYAHAYYTEEEFWKIYDKSWYSRLRKKYNAEAVFPDIWQKVHVNERYKVNKWKGAGKILLETIKGKNINA